MDLPPDVKRLLWDIDPDALDPKRHLDFVIERVMQRGNWAAMQWLRAQLATDQLVDFVNRRGHRLSPRDSAYWRLVLGMPLVAQTTGGGRPTWLP